MPSFLSQQERRILAAARANGAVKRGESLDFEWRQAARSAGIRPDEAADLLKGLRRFGFIEAVGSSHARLTETGARAADEL